MSEDVKKAEDKATEGAKQNAVKVNPLVKGSGAAGFNKIEIPEKGSGFVKLEFLGDFGTKKKGDTEVYHVSTAEALVHKGHAKVVEKLMKYVPKVVKQQAQQ